ncbi:MAG: hypothetical protein ACREAD_02440 [Nitrosopumilaceae archaeon]
MSSKLMLAVFVTAVLMTSIAAVTIPAASALTSRSSFNDNHYTANYPGGPRICGDHMCAPGEYDKMQEALAQAQMKGKTGTSTPQGNMTQGNMPQMQNKLASSDCQKVQAALTDAQVNADKAAKVMAALGCS